MSIWKGPVINQKTFIGLKKKRVSKKIQIIPSILGLRDEKKITSRMLGLKLGQFFFTRRKVWHKK
jgi:ribosomal protein S19